MIIILGSGLAGCLAGVMNRDAAIYESLEQPMSHKAILRFRSPDIGEAVGIPFEKIKVHKGIYQDGSFHNVNPKLISLYSQKVSGTIAARSIQDIETVDRWIAPENFHEMLLEMCRHQLMFKAEYESVVKTKSVKISTLPMPMLAGIYNKQIDTTGHKNTIYVNKYRIDNCDAHMTVYYTDPRNPIYRASLVKDILTIESMDTVDGSDEIHVFDSFGIDPYKAEIITSNFQQNNGKISPIDENTRRNFIHSMTVDHNVYSLGRFATWRNLLLDDVFKDLLVIKRLMNKDLYQHHLEVAQ